MFVNEKFTGQLLKLISSVLRWLKDVTFLYSAETINTHMYNYV